MNYKDRLITKRLRTLVSNFPVVVISGARQVGKSTLLTHEFNEWEHVTFDPVIDIENARQDPELFLDNHATPLILDEIQYCPEIVSCLKRRVDNGKKPGMYILTGSQQWSALKSISESMAGRAVFLDLEGFTCSEKTESIKHPTWLERYLDSPEEFVQNQKIKRVEQPISLYETLWRGNMPEVDQLPLEIIPDYFSAYLRTYIERDVRLVLEVDDWQQFGRFVQLTSALSSQEINFSQLGREIGITPQTAKRWIASLKATYQWFDIPAYHGNSIKRISSKPKGYFSDVGLACHLQMISSHNALGGHPSLGALFETNVYAEIRKMMSSTNVKANIYHWRIHGGSEIDLLLERDNTLYPIEIKSKSQPSRKDTRGLHSFRKHYPKAKIAPGLVLAPTHEKVQLSEFDYSIPWDIQ